MLIGAHVSAAGGVDKVFARGHEIGAECIQLFTRAPSQWRAAPIKPEVLERFKAARAAHGNPQVFAHDLYLTNLASADEEIRQRSIASLIEEVARCAALALNGLVCHMGSHAQEEEGLELLALGLAEVLRQTSGSPVVILLETTAGQGTNLGHRFEHIRYCLDKNSHHERLATCLDTCHVTAAGYDMSSAATVEATLNDFERVVGLERLRLLHLNDSKKELGSRVDRHHHIGQGAVGLEGFRALLGHARMEHLPMIIETPEMESMHSVNLALLKEFRSAAQPKPAARGGAAVRKAKR